MQEDKKAPFRTKPEQDTHDINVEPKSDDLEANIDDTSGSCCSQCWQGFQKCMPCYWNNADNKLALFGMTDGERFLWEIQIRTYDWAHPCYCRICDWQNKDLALFSLFSSFSWTAEQKFVWSQ